MRKVFLITSDRIGAANPELGALLMRNFLYSLARAETKPDVVFLANDGVRLACEGSESLGDLDLLAVSGVNVLACGTCLDYLKLMDALKVGAVGKMPELVGWMADAEDVVTVC
jgi:selenium metabolism protein YedF